MTVVPVFCTKSEKTVQSSSLFNSNMETQQGKWDGTLRQGQR